MIKVVHVNRWRTPGSTIHPDHPAFWAKTPWYLQLIGYPARRHYCLATYSLEGVYMYEGFTTTKPGHDGEFLDWRPEQAQGPSWTP